MGKQKPKKGPAKRAPKNRKRKSQDIIFRDKTSMFGYPDPSSRAIAKENGSQVEHNTASVETFVSTLSASGFRVHFNPEIMEFEVLLSLNKGKGTSTPLWGAPGGKNNTTEETPLDVLKNHMQKETSFVVLPEEVILLSSSTKKNEKSEDTPFEKRFYLNLVKYSKAIPSSNKESVLKSEFVSIKRVFGELHKNMIQDHFSAIKPLFFFVQTKCENVSEAEKAIEMFKSLCLKEKSVDSVAV